MPVAPVVGQGYYGDEVAGSHFDGMYCAGNNLDISFDAETGHQVDGSPGLEIPIEGVMRPLQESHGCCGNGFRGRRSVPEALKQLSPP